jgi:hypothetical protein
MCHSPSLCVCVYSCISSFVDMHLAVYAELQHINLSSCSILILNLLVEHNEIQEQ